VPSDTRCREEADWLYAANVPSWAGASVGDRAWRFLRQSLERSNGPTTDWEYWKVVYEVLVTNQKERPPKWLISVLEVSRSALVVFLQRLIQESKDK